MPLYSYEIHQMDDKRLPFIFHKDYIFRDDTNKPSFFNWHTNLEILSVVSGKGYIKCEKRTYNVEVGDIIIINSDVMHCSLAESDDFSYYCLIVDAAYCKENGFDTEKITFEEKIKDTLISNLFDKVVACKKDVESGASSAVARYRIAVTELLAELYDRHLFINDDGASHENQSMQYVKKAMVYISENSSNQISLDEIASYTGISKFYLSRLFKFYTGHSIFNHINMIRCRSAQALISYGMSVSEAASQCGFENMSYFSRTFKKLMGILPSEV